MANQNGCPNCGQENHGFDIVAHGIEVCPVCDWSPAPKAIDDGWRGK